MEMRLGEKVPKKYLKIARYRERLVKAFLKKLSSNPDRSHSKIIKRFLKYHNEKSNQSQIFLIRGHLSRSTLYVWLHAYKKNGIDALIPHYRGYSGVPQISNAEAQYLIDLLANNFRIGTAIRVTKYLLKRENQSSCSSPATLRRWAQIYLKEKEN